MGRSASWTDKENECCTRAWLSASENVKKGSEMRGNVFVDKMYDAFGSFAKESIKDSSQLKVALARKKRPIMDRWRATIMPAITKFVGIKKKIDELNESGTTEEDAVRKALDEYEEVHETPFDFEGCWKIAKDHPKWSLLAMTESATSLRPSTPSSAKRDLPADSKQNYGRDAGRKLAVVDAKEHAAFEKMAASIREATRESSTCIQSSMEKHNQILEAKIKWSMFQNVDDDDARQFKELARQNAIMQAKLKHQQLRKQLQQQEHRAAGGEEH